jgi:acetylornithine deacetylase/succinyl-diaminopimelate desuccinylase
MAAEGGTMLEHVTESEIVQLLQEMIRLPTVNPPADTGACAQVLLEVCRAKGIEAEILEGRPGAANVVARLVGERPGKQLVLNGHIDTVPAGEGWTVDPFGGEIIQGKLYGRGSCDMKSGVATMLMALVDLKRSGVPFAGEIIFQAVADEETGSQFGTLHLLEQGIGAGADFAICTEPTSLRVELGNRGLRWLDVTVEGVASHAGRPHLGVNAVERAARLIAAISEMRFAARNDFFEIPEPSISVTTVSGGETVNVIPDRCRFAIDRRMIPGETETQVLAELESVIEPFRQEHPEHAITVDVRPGGWDPYLISADEPVVQAALKAVRHVTGHDPEVTSKAACTDASHLVARGGIPTVLFGPGNERLSHKPDECVAIADLLTGAAVYRRMFDLLLTS